MATCADCGHDKLSEQRCPQCGSWKNKTIAVIDWIGYQLLMRFDAALNPYTRFGRWCLVRAGCWAYRS